MGKNYSGSVTVFLVLLFYCTSAAAEWKASGAEVVAAAKDPNIAAVLAAVNQLDRSVIQDDHAVFASLMAEDLVVNNPINSISSHGATVQLNAAGRIRYSQYDRTIEYAGIREGMVLLMGEEACVARSPHPMADKLVRRRFTDLWKNQNGRWVLTVRQATVIAPERPPVAGSQ
ncbi:MAG: nuclear transport factor 2 family protein [Rhodocyclaceae bacterium]|nr:nuclear transport factor 2 family protein [Rhodocyclaceae bacterium]